MLYRSLPTYIWLLVLSTTTRMSKKAGKPDDSMLSPPRLSGKRHAEETPGRGEQKFSKCTDSSSVTMSAMKDLMMDLLKPLNDDISAIRSELVEMRTLQLEVQALKTQMESLQPVMMEKVQTALDERVPINVAKKLDLMLKSHEADKCSKQAIIFGLPKGVNRQSIRSYLDTVDSGIQSLRVFTDKSDRPMGSLRFRNKDERDTFVSSFKMSERKFSQDNQTHVLRIKHDLPEHTRLRNSKLQTKFRDVKASLTDRDAVELDWASRTILINGQKAFVQRHGEDEVVPMPKKFQ